MKTRRVVITGFGAVTPLGYGREALWQGLREGRSGLARISAYDPGTEVVQVAAEVKNLTRHHPLPAKEQRWVSRCVPLALLASSEALLHAGLDPRQMDVEERRSFGVCLGSGGGPAAFTEKNIGDWQRSGLRGVPVYAVASGTIGNLSSEISMYFDLHGPSQVISTGCTSSTDALGLAFLQLQSGRGRRMLVGGVDAPISRGILAGFGMMKVCSTAFNHEPTRASRPFDRDRDGFVPGEGAWMFVLEDLEAARERGAGILAEVLGYGATCDAHHRVRLDESGVEPARAMTSALEDAGLAPQQVDHLQLHGTGTRLNDCIETRAVKLALGDQAKSIPMSSVKSSLGHPQGASGAAGVGAALMALNQGWLAPTLNLENPDADCDLDYVPLQSRRHKVNTVLCNCIGFGSKNAALVLGKVQ